MQLFDLVRLDYSSIPWDLAAKVENKHREELTSPTTIIKILNIVMLPQRLIRLPHFEKLGEGNILYMDFCPEHRLLKKLILMKSIINIIQQEMVSSYAAVFQLMISNSYNSEITMNFLI